MSGSPTTRSLKYLRDQGYLSQVVEKWIPQAGKRVDLFGFIDILALKGGEVLGVQTTSASNLSARVKKIQEHENVGVVRDAGIAIHCHGWRKNSKNRWVITVRDLS